ncbi:hypothetical protein D3C71_1840720 [compost metagenome]
MSGIDYFLSTFHERTMQTDDIRGSEQFILGNPTKPVEWNLEALFNLAVSRDYLHPHSTGNSRSLHPYSAGAQNPHCFSGQFNQR